MTPVFPHSASAASSERVRIAVLITCFNRREVTLRCLANLYAQRVDGCELTVFVVDDASSDGTSEAIRQRFPEVRLYEGTGDLFWTRGMHRAFDLAMREDFDYYLWLNDDTMLFPGTVGRMLVIAEGLKGKGIDAIVVGNTRDSATGRHTYGGVKRKRGLKRASFQLVELAEDQAARCDSMHGNCVLISRESARVVGNLDPFFQHNFGDLDYGLRASAAGVRVYVAPGYAGSCSENEVSGTWRDRRPGLRARWRAIQSPKGCPWPEWMRFTRRHIGGLWFLYAMSPYVKLFLAALVGRRRNITPLSGARRGSTI